MQRGVLALRHVSPDGSEQWFWRSKIDVTEWDKKGEAWLPSKAVLSNLSPRAVLPESLPGLWPAEPAGVELTTLCSWFDGSHAFQEVTQPGYPPESRAVPKVAVAEIHKAVAQAVKAGDLWLVFGNDSVWQDEPTTLQLDATAKIYRQPAMLNSFELLPNALLKDAWSKDAEPKTMVEKLYTELKKLKGNPWPPKLFIGTLSDAIGRGLVARVSGNGPLVSLSADANVELAVKSSAPPPVPPTPPSGRKLSERVCLSPGEFQDLADEVATLSKSLAGCDVQFEVAVSIKTKAGMDLKTANEVLGKIKDGWKL